MIRSTLLSTLILGSFHALMASEVMVHDAYVRATPPAVINSAAFMTLHNHSKNPLALVKATSDVAKKVELHTHDMVDGQMRMYEVPKIELPAQSHTTLKPGGFHVMLLGLHKPLIEGQKVTLNLQLSDGTTLTLAAPVKKVMAGMQMEHGAHHGHH